MGMPGATELIIILLIVLILFGANKVPKIAKDLGGGIKEFKKAVSNEETEEIVDETVVKKPVKSKTKKKKK